MSDERPTPCSPWPSLWPIIWLGGQFIILGLVFVSLSESATSTLVDVPMGQRMLAIAASLFAINIAIYWPLSAWFVRRIVGSRDRSATLWWIALVGLTVTCLVFLVIPVGFVLTIGPSAVQIQNDLAS